MASLAHKHSGNVEEVNVLDVGCGTGNTLVELDRLGVTARYFVADVDKRCIAITKTRVSVAGEFLIDSVGELITENDGGYDIVLYSHVLQYEHRPRDVISHLVGKLNNDGRLIIAVSNVMTLPKLLNSIRKKHYSEGIVTWDKSTLHNLLNSIPSCVVELWDSDYLPLPLLGSSKIGMKLGNLLGRVFPNLCFSIVVVVRLRK